MASRRSGILVIAAGILGALAFVLALLVFLVRPLDTPERRIDAYLAATAVGDEPAALDVWKVFTGGAHPLPALLARRSQLTHELAIAHVGSTYTIRSIDWWRTCCEPGPIDNARNAGLARAHVLATDPTGKAYDLVFEVFVKELIWWGDAGGPTNRDWTLYEVHGESEPCVFPSTAFGCVR